MSGLLLYHSFPKPRKAAKGQPSSTTSLGGTDSQRGMEQLELMIEYGMLLTHEELDIPLRDQRHEKFDQVRACFTLLRREELWTGKPTHGDDRLGPSHSEMFGNFAIGIDPISARKFGMGPVKYFYLTEPSDSSNITVELLRNLWELRSLALIVSAMEWKACIEGHKPIPPEELEKKLTCQSCKEVKEKWEAIQSSDKATVRKALGYLDTVRKPAWSLVDSIDLALCFYQTVDVVGRDRRTAPRRGLLGNFQLHEWRLPLFYHDSVSVAELGLEEDRLTDFIAKLIKFGLKGEDLKKCAIFEGFGDRNFFSYVDEVICPTCVADEAQQLLGRDFRLSEEGGIEGVDLVVFQRPKLSFGG